MVFLLSAQSGANALKTHTHTQGVTVRTRHLVDLQSTEEKKKLHLTHINTLQRKSVKLYETQNIVMV